MGILDALGNYGQQFQNYYGPEMNTIGNYAGSVGGIVGNSMLDPFRGMMDPNNSANVSTSRPNVNISSSLNTPQLNVNQQLGITPSTTTTGLLGSYTGQQTTLPVDAIPAEGNMLQQIGGFFQDRPAFTQGLLTAGIAAGAGAPAWMIGATGGQAMQNRQQYQMQMAMSQRQYQQQQFENAMKLADWQNANIAATSGQTNAQSGALKNLYETGTGPQTYAKGLEEAGKIKNLNGEQQAIYAKLYAQGKVPQLSTNWLGHTYVVQ